MKKLLLIVPMLHQGGFERVCVETAYLMRERYDVTLLIFSDRDRHYNVDGLRVVNIDTPAAQGTVKKALTLLQRVRRLRAYKKAHGIDVAYSFGLTANLANVMSRAGECVVTSLRSSLDFEAAAKMRRIVRGSDLMISCARQMAEIAREAFHAKNVKLLYNPLDLAGITAAAREAITDETFLRCSPLLVSMGRDDDAKGYWHLLRIFSLLKRQFPGAGLVVIGDGSFADARRLAEALSLSESVFFTGVRENPFPYLAAADLYLLTSNHEGFPNAMVEAMALAKPVIAADCVSGPREILMDAAAYEGMPKVLTEVTEGAYGILVPTLSATPDYETTDIPEEDRLVAETACHLLSDPERLKRLSAAAYGRAESFSAARYRTGLSEILEEAQAADGADGNGK